MDLRSEGVALPQETEDKQQQRGSRKGSECDDWVAPSSFEVMLALSRGVAALANILPSVCGEHPNESGFVDKLEEKFNEALSVLNHQVAALQDASTPAKEINPSSPLPEVEESPLEKHVGSPSVAVIESGPDVYVSEDGHYVVRKIDSDCFSVHKDGVDTGHNGSRFQWLRDWLLPADLVEKIWRGEKVEIRDLGDDSYNVYRDGTLWFEDLRLLDLRISILPPFLLEEVWGKGHPKCDFEEIEQYFAELSKASVSKCKNMAKTSNYSQSKLEKARQSLIKNKVIQAVAQFAIDEYNLKKSKDLRLFGISQLSLHNLHLGFECNLVLETVNRSKRALADYSASVRLTRFHRVALQKFKLCSNTIFLKRKREAEFDYEMDISELRELDEVES